MEPTRATYNPFLGFHLFTLGVPPRGDNVYILPWDNIGLRMEMVPSLDIHGAYAP